MKFSAILPLAVVAIAPVLAQDWTDANSLDARDPFFGMFKLNLNGNNLNLKKNKQKAQHHHDKDDDDSEDKDEQHKKNNEDLLAILEDEIKTLKSV